MSTPEAQIGAASASGLVYEQVYRNNETGDLFYFLNLEGALGDTEATVLYGPIDDDGDPYNVTLKRPLSDFQANFTLVENP